jgi:hypothetical protein
VAALVRLALARLAGWPERRHPDRVRQMLAPRRRMTTEVQEWRDRNDRIAWEMEQTAA